MKDPKQDTLNISIHSDMLFDLKNYAKENGMVHGDVVRQLIHDEIYKSYRLAKKSHDKKTIS